MTIIYNILVGLSLLFLTPPDSLDSSTGYAVYSNKGIAQLVIANRASWGQDVSCATCVGYAAVADCSKLGSYLWISKDQKLEGPFRVHDCCSAAHRIRFEALQRIVEVDGFTAERWQMRGPIIVTIYWGKDKPKLPELILAVDEQPDANR